MKAQNDYEVILAESKGFSCDPCIFRDKDKDGCIRGDSFPTCCPSGPMSLLGYHYVLAHKLTGEIVNSEDLVNACK